MKTEKEEELKRSWDLKETEDFEEFKDLLYEFLRECEIRWSCERYRHLKEKSRKLGFMGNINLASYIESLEKRIEALERH